MSRNLKGVLVVLAVVGLASEQRAHADTESKFAELRDKSDRFEGSFAAFLDRFVGECNDPLEASTCKQASAEFRKKVKGKKFYFIIGEDQVSNLSAGSYNPSRNEFTVNLTPFFPAGGYALTQGAPKKTDANGNPVFPFLPIKVKLPPDFSPQRFARTIGNKEVRMQLVFTPQATWAIAKRGGGKLEGVQAQLEGVVLSLASSGDTLGAYYGR